MTLQAPDPVPSAVDLAATHSPLPAGVERYVAFMQGMRYETLERLPEIVTEDIHFVDPFNDLVGIAPFEHCLRDMLDQVGGLRIQVFSAGMLTPLQPDVTAAALLRWRFDGTLVKLGNRPWSVDGVSEVRLAADGRVREHLDYWDAAQGLYEQLPVIGWVMKQLRRRLAVDPTKFPSPHA